MYSDTHCHLSHVAERGENLAVLLDSLASKEFRFVLDIGTKSGDFDRRIAKVRAAGDLPPFLFFSCGLWPDGKVIAERQNAIVSLEADIEKMLVLSKSRGSALGFAALGECGLDRFWNGLPALERIALAKSSSNLGSGTGSDSDDGPGTADIAGEEELFGLQLDLAKRYDLSVIIHSRDAFDATLAIIKNSGRDVGVIHCFSYGVDEARLFLDRGWYISFPGNITWAKKDADRDRIARLLRYVPEDRFLLETDAPYMAPFPHRGKTNTPLLIEHTYAYAAGVLGIQSEILASRVYENATRLFSISGAT